MNLAKLSATCVVPAIVPAFRYRLSLNCSLVIPGRGHSLRTRNPGTQALKVLEKPVFMDSGLRPLGGPGMTVLPVTFNWNTYRLSG
jgi:hypothetical protein